MVWNRVQQHIHATAQRNGKYGNVHVFQARPPSAEETSRLRSAMDAAARVSKRA
jgi:hypothetical protein